jgi:carbamoyltransferase
MIVLGLKYGGHDCAASLLVDGELVACCEQERYTRDKHSRRFPTEAIADCLKIGGISLDEVTEVAFVNDYNRLIREIYLRPALASNDRLAFMVADMERIKRFHGMEGTIRELTGFRGPISFHRHHLCHMASAYYPSGFDDALLVCYDGFGESETTSLGLGRSGVMEIVHDRNQNPNSLGLVYSALTYFLGWLHHCDEGIIMGLAPFGDASAIVPGTMRSYYDFFAEMIRESGDYDFDVDLSWFEYYRVRDTWVSQKFKDVFGPVRQHGGPLTDHHRNIAAALQKRLEDIALGHMRKARKEFGMRRICLSGGVALNCSMNGKILASGLFDEVFVQPASGDQGTTVGACFLAYRNSGNDLRPCKMHNFYKGSRFTDVEIKAVLDAAKVRYSRPDDLYAVTAEHLAAGKIVAWFQGGAEFGPRALGNRSILARPFPEGMRDHLNKRVKFREEFRPYAPAVMAERCNEYFDVSQPSPHMLLAVRARPEHRDQIAATVHIDNSARVQTVTSESNARFYKLLQACDRKMGVPVLLNTSFNVKGQPIVNTAKEAIDTFLSTKIDVLAIGDYLVAKEDA